jgi:Ser/Thr protein kinase RdoA (MazF antagonist)
MSSLSACGDHVVVRIARAAHSADAETRFLDAMQAAGLRVPRLVREIVDLGDGWSACALERVVADGPVDWCEVGRMVATVHSIDPAPFTPLPWCLDFAHWDIDAGLAGIADDTDEAAMAGLRAALGRWPDWRRTLAAEPQVLSHGDVHPGNVVFTAAGPVLIDWDLRCRAPRGWDHAAVRTWPTRWGGTASMYTDFARGYGMSLEADAATDCLAELRLVVATVMRVMAGRTDSLASHEASQRLRFWRGEPDAPQWVAQ